MKKILVHLSTAVLLGIVFSFGQVIARGNTHLVETFTGPRYNLGSWIESGAETDGFNGRGQFTIASPYRGLRRIIGSGSFESLFEITNINLNQESSSINLGFVPRDSKSKLILVISPKNINLIFRELEAEPAINEKYEKQAEFEKCPQSLKVKITWNANSKRWRIFYGIDGDEPTIEIPQSKKGLYFTQNLDDTAETLVFVRDGTIDVDHFELGSEVKGSKYYENRFVPQMKPAKPDDSFGSYYDCKIEATAGSDFTGAEFRVWIPNNVTTIKGIIVRQHGAGGNGKSLANDAQFQALAKEHGYALMGSFMKATKNFGQWTNPRKGSGPAFIQALEKLAIKSGHRELEEVPWILWGHSAGGHWANYMAREYPGRVKTLICRSGHGSEYIGSDLKIPNLQIAGEKEVDTSQQWFRKLMSAGDLRAVAIEPGVGHACTNSRFLTVAFIEAVLAELKKNGQMPLERTKGWLGDIDTLEIADYESFKGNKDRAYWLVNEIFARQWREFLQTGNFTDSTAPKRPAELTVKTEPAGKVVLNWKSEADIESGIRNFNIYREGKKIASVPGQGWNRGDEPEPINWVTTYTDQLTSADLKKIDSAVLKYSVTAVNYASLESGKKYCEVPLIGMFTFGR